MSNYSEDEELKKTNTEGYFVPGVCLALCANRTSYAFDFRGTSYTCDTACSASFFAFSQAINDIKSGRVENAVVGGAHLMFSPHETAEFTKLQVLSQNSKSKPYSSERNGYVRSEAVVAVLLQKKNNCKRIYATVLGAGTNSDGYKKEGISYPSYEMHLELLRTVYDVNNLDPNDVTYFEGHGTGLFFNGIHFK